MIIKTKKRGSHKHRLMVEDYLLTTGTQKDVTADDVRAALHLSPIALSNKHIHRIATKLKFDIDMEGELLG